MNNSEAIAILENALRAGKTLDAAFAELPPAWLKPAQKAMLTNSLNFRQSTRRNIQAKIRATGKPSASKTYIDNLGGLDFVPGLGGVLPYGQGPNPKPVDPETAIASVIAGGLVSPTVTPGTPRPSAHGDPAPPVAPTAHPVQPAPGRSALRTVAIAGGITATVLALGKLLLGRR